MEKVPVEKREQIRIGMVYSCGDWHSPKSEDYYCVIIGVFGTKLYYFRKKDDLQLHRYELVSFIIDENNPNEAKHVIALKQYEIVSGENNCFKMPNGRADNYAFSLYREGKKYEDCTEITNEELKAEIVRLHKYIDGLDSTSIINTFVVRESGALQRRLGRDDYYWQITTRSVESDDLYINQLLRTGEDRAYEVTNSYEESYDYIDEKATQEGIQTALSTYDNNGHLAFLLNEYIKLRHEQMLKKSEIELKLKGLFCVDKVDFNIGYLADYSYKSVVEEYNKLISKNK